MMIVFFRCIAQRSQPLWDLIVSAVGGVAFVAGVRPLAIWEKASATPLKASALAAARDAAGSHLAMERTGHLFLSSVEVDERLLGIKRIAPGRSRSGSKRRNRRNSSR